MTAETSSLPQGGELRGRILAGFRGDVPPLRPSFGYRLTLAAVAFVMVLLPLLYAGLTLALAWGLWAYGRMALSTLLPEAQGLLPLLVVLLPLFIGGVVLICLVKPFFARPAKRAAPLKLDPRQEPLLFEFVSRLCSALHAPAPREIHIDCQVNASASFRQGLLSLFSHDLVLTIGLPLVASLSLQQLAGVMAHELGHFSQKAGLRVSILIRAVNFWFARLVYERDRFDLALLRAADRTRIAYFRWPLRITLFCLSMTRRVLWALMMLGHVLSSFLMRQMEYDADRYEVRLAGFSSFDFSMRELFALSVAHQISMANLQDQWKEGRLVDNFPRLVIANRKEGVRQIGAQLEHWMSREPERLFSTHPTGRQRIARALRERGVGVYSSDLPASSLFSDVDALERQASLTFYREMLGNRLKPQDLIPLAAAQERQMQTENDRAALERYFQNPDHLRGLPLPAKLPQVNAEPPLLAAELEKARKAVQGKDQQHSAQMERYQEAAGERITALRAEAVLQAGFRIRPGEFNLHDGQPDTAARNVASALAQMEAIGAQLEPYEKLEVRRLLLGLLLLGSPRKEEAEKLLACAAFLKDTFPRMFGLRETRAVLEILLHQIDPQEENPRLFATINERLALLQERLKDLHRSLRSQSYPFDHARQEMSLAQFVLPQMPANDDLQGLMSAAELALERLYEVYDRLLGRMARMAEEVEAQLGMAPLSKSSSQPETPGLPHPQAPAFSGVPAPSAPLLAAAHNAAPAVLTHSQALASGAIQESKAEAVESRERYIFYFRSALEWRTLPVPEVLPQLDADPRPLLETLRDACRAVSEGQEAYSQKVRQYQGLERRWIKALHAEELVLGGLTIRPADFELPRGDHPAVAHAQSWLLSAMQSLEPELQQQEEALGRRLATALLLLGDERIAFRVEGADRRRQEIPALLACVAALQRRFPQMREMRKIQTALEILGPQVRTHGNIPHLQNRVQERMGQAHRHLQDLQRILHPEPSPFSGPRGAVSLAQVAVPSLPGPTDYSDIFQASGWALKEILDLHRRVLGRLAGTAEAVEAALGLKK